jgi:hypothetical protein
MNNAKEDEIEPIVEMCIGHKRIFAGYTNSEVPGQVT